MAQAMRVRVPPWAHKIAGLFAGPPFYYNSKMDIEKIESAIELTLKKRYPDPSRKRKEIASLARKLSDLFTKERVSISQNYFARSGFRTAYLEHFTLINCVKTSLCLKELQLPFRNAPIKILDIGCGTAAALAAASATFPERKLEMTGVDASVEILDDASEFLSNVVTDVHGYRLVNKTISNETLIDLDLNEKFDIIIAANFLNEFGSVSYANFIQRIADKNLADDGYLIVIEPALKKTSRALMEQRNFLAHLPACKIVAPCLHHKNCPMLSANYRDWCHFYAGWKSTDKSKAMDALVGTDRTHLKYSYLIVQKSIKASTPHVRLTHRVISSPLKSKGKLEFLLCGSDGVLRKIRRLDKDSSVSNYVMEKMMRGDIVSCAADSKISSSSEIKILRTFLE